MIRKRKLKIFKAEKWVPPPKKSHIYAINKLEKLNPSLEPCHAFAEAIKIAPKLRKDTIIIVNSCGDAQKDRDILKQRLGKLK